MEDGGGTASRPSDPRGRGRRVWVIIVLLLCLGGAGAWIAHGRQSKLQQAKPAGTGSGPGAAGQQTRPVPVVVTPVRSGDLTVYLTALGSVTPLNTVTVKSRVDGQLMRTHFTEGQLIQTGDLLAEIDPRPFQAQLVQAEGQLARDQANLANARLDLERYRRLAEQAMIARQQLDTQQMVVNQAEAAMKVNDGVIESIKLQLSYCRITSPITGRVGLRLVDPGNVIKASDPGGLVVITQLEPIALIFSVPEDSLQPILRRFRSGTPVPVEAYDREGRRKIATGTLAAIDNQIDTTTGTVRLKGSFNNRDGALYPNQFVNARVLIDVLHDALLAPAEAIQRGPQGPFVYVTKDKVVELRRIQLGPSEGGIVAVKTGVAAGETVVVDGTERVSNGARVEPTTRQAGAKPGPGATGASGDRPAGTGTPGGPGEPSPGAPASGGKKGPAGPRPGA